VAAGVFSLTTGCATIGAGQPVHSDVPVGTGEQEQPSGETVDIEQSGTALTLRSRKLCDVHETREVTRTTTTPRENKSAWVDWTLGLGGAALAGAGAVTLIDSGNVASSDETSRTYNPVGGTGAVVLGAGLIAIGVAGGTVALVDVFRAGGADESKARVSLPGRELQRGVACKTPVPVASVELALLVPHARGEKDERVALGKTGSDGVLRVDLERVVSDEFVSAEKAYVVRDTTEVGKVDLAPVRAAHEASAWSKLDKEACAAPKKSDACAPVKVFMKKYPASAHVAEARLLVAKAQPTIETLEDAEAWAGTNADGCVRPAGRDIVGAENMCDQLQRYIDAYPNGKHVTEAKAAIAKGRPAIKRAQDDAARVAREEEAAQKRREQQEAARQKAALQTECNAKCNVMCSRRVNPGMCVSGCVQLCVNQGGN
jgi:hypothetical protein